MKIKIGTSTAFSIVGAYVGDKMLLKTKQSSELVIYNLAVVEETCSSLEKDKFKLGTFVSTFSLT
jgi:hypothetical protein